VSLKELRSVTLLVTPDQAAKIDLGQNLGTLHLTLRNPLDKDPIAHGAATLKDLRIQAKRSMLDQFKGLLEAAAKVAASRPPAPKKVEKDEKSQPITTAAPPPPPTIRTLRGVVPSKVRLDQ
jgi:Flp pilus assembly protein CpaB